MIYGREWTAQRVLDRLAVAFEKLPDSPIYSSSSELKPAHAFKPVDGLDLIAATAPCLGRDSPARIALLTLARARGRRQSIRALCQELGWNRATAYRRSRQAAAHVAHCLNTRSDLGRILPFAEPLTRQ
jgi:hypothetical protein